MSIDQTTLTASVRSSETGKGPARRMRAKGQIPAVVYGKTTAPASLSVDPVALRKALQTPHKMNTVITVKVAGSPDRIVMLKDWQQHPVSRELLHADFQEVRLDQPVRVDVPVVLTGKAQGVVDGGLLTQVSRSISLLCLPRAIPEQISADVTNVKIGQSLHESDLTLAEGIKLASRVDLTIAIVSAPEAEGPAGGAAAAPAAGAAAAPAAAAAKGAPAKGAAPAKDAKAAPAKK